jgi:parvulin-like peptidyl-prolyl isomerase
MRILALTLALAFIALPTFAAPPAASPKAEAPASDPKQVVATFNGEKIAMQQVEEEIKRQPILGYQWSLAKGDEQKKNDVRRLAVHAIVERKLLLFEAKKSNVVSDAEVTQQVGQFINANYGGDEQLATMLKGMGTTLDRFKSEVGDDFRIKAFLEKKVFTASKPAEDEIKKEYEANPAAYAQPEAVHARHILIKVTPEAPDAEQKKAEEKIHVLYAQAVAKDTDFALLAKNESQDGSASQGGDLGYFSRGMMVPEFEKAAFETKPGEVSKPVRSKFGWHIIKVEDRRAATAPSFETAKPGIEKKLINQHRTELIKAKLEGLKKESKLEIKIP